MLLLYIIVWSSKSANARWIQRKWLDIVWFYINVLKDFYIIDGMIKMTVQVFFAKISLLGNGLNHKVHSWTDLIWLKKINTWKKVNKQSNEKSMVPDFIKPMDGPWSRCAFYNSTKKAITEKASGYLSGETATVFPLIKITPNMGNNGILPGNFCMGSNKYVYENDIQKRKQKQT